MKNKKVGEDITLLLRRGVKEHNEVRTLSISG